MNDNKHIPAGYKIIESLGDNQYSHFYRAQDKDGQRAVILQVIDVDGLAFNEDTYVELELLHNKLKLANLEFVLSLIRIEKGEHLVLVYADTGISPIEVGPQHKKALSPEESIAYLRQVTQMLLAGFEMEIEHQDLSSANLFRASQEKVLLAGFGLSSALNLEPKLHQSVHHPVNDTGSAVQKNIYGLGVLLYEMLTGDVPDMVDVEGKRKPDADVSVSVVLPNLPSEADDLIEKCLSINPQDRPHDYEAFLMGLDEVEAGLLEGDRVSSIGIEDALVGHTLGPYRLVERFGQGGMATVYKGYEAALDRYVAIKVLPQIFSKDPDFVKRFQTEARAVAQLNHPNIVPIYHSGEHDGIAYIAMQFVEGGTLKQKRGEKLDPEKAVSLLLPVVRALEFAHQRGIIHRDVKPSNVLLAEGGWPMLADFGLARMMSATSRLTQSGVGMGTPMYMSPEQGQGVNVDHRTDIYALGIMLYEMLTGDVPFRADTPMAIIIKHMTAPMPIPRDVNPSISAVLERIILKATSKEPVDRYQDAADLALALEDALSDLQARPYVAPAALEIPEVPILIPEKEIVPQHQPPKAKVPWRWLFSIGGIAALLVLGIFFGPGLFQQPANGEGTPLASAMPADLAASTQTQQNQTEPSDDDAQSVDPASGGGGLLTTDIIFQDDFDNRISATWQIQEGAWSVEELDDGRTVLVSPHRPDNPEGDVSIVLDSMVFADVQDYRVEFDLMFTGYDEYDFSFFKVRGRINECPVSIDRMGGYNLRISMDHIDLQKEVCVQGSGGTELARQFISIDGHDWHTYKLSYIGGVTSVEIDGIELLTYEDSDDPLDGQGFWFEMKGQYQIVVDNFVVYQVSQAETNVTQLTSSSEADGEFVFADMNNDGFDDIVLGGGSVLSIIWGGSESGSTPQLLPFAGGRIHAVAVGDIDNDTDQDIVVGTSEGQWIYLNDGAGNFEFHTEFGDGHTWDLALGDLNGDGYLDIYECSAGGNTIWFNQDGQTFLPGETTYGNADSVSVELGDLDGDGDSDAYVGNVDTQDSVWLNEGDGVFTLHTTLNYGVTNDVALGDFDGDGYLDVFVANRNGSGEAGTNLDTPAPNSVFLNLGNGLFRNTGQKLGDSYSMSVSLADLDGDGDLDAFVGNGLEVVGEEQDEIWINDGAGTFSALDSEFAVPNYSIYVNIYDWNNDGINDLFVLTEFDGLLMYAIE